MLDPIFAQLQYELYQSILGDLQSLTSSVPGAGSTYHSAMLARSSEFDGLIAAAAERYELDPTLLKAVVQAESNFSPQAISHAGAKGLMQLMDATAQHLGVADVFDPGQNIDGGARFLQQLLQRYGGNEVLALAAYNAGPGAVDHWGGVPPYQETQQYVPKILALRQQYREWRG